MKAYNNRKWTVSVHRLQNRHLTLRRSLLRPAETVSNSMTGEVVLRRKGSCRKFWLSSERLSAAVCLRGDIKDDDSLSDMGLGFPVTLVLVDSAIFV